MNHNESISMDEVRVDVWLWAARIFKSRDLAKQMINIGRVHLNGARCKPSRLVKISDWINVIRGEERLQLEILALSTRRGPAPIAQQLYRESEASVAARQAQQEQNRQQVGLIAPLKRPNKKARRQLRQFKEIH